MDEASDEIYQDAPQPPANDLDHVDSSGWWFASAGFPMIAGTLGPVASSFSILALVKPWRQAYPPGTDVDTAPFISDPAWLTAINAVQLFLAIIANMALFLNMTRRLNFSIAQPVTIVGWYVSSFALIALTATAAGPLVIEPSDEFIWSQAFFYAIYSASLYFLVASLMVITYAGAQAHRYPKDFMLTASQRTLMLQTILFVLYLLIGALIFCAIEDWDYYDALYWAAVTLFTVGFGDIFPTTTLAQSLVIPYALVGIISLGLVIGSIRSLALDYGKARLDARIVEKKRRRALRRITRQGKDEVLIPIKDDSLTLSSVPTDESLALTEFSRREREFKLMRKIQETAARHRRWFAMCVSTGTWLVLWLVGAKVFEKCEARYQGWSYFDGFYFTFTSWTTIGYGNLAPRSNAGRSFWVFWALLALPTMTVLISNAGETIVKDIQEVTDRVATVTILPSDAGFNKDLRKLLHRVSFGFLYAKEVEQETPGFLGSPEHIRRVLTQNLGGVHAQETMRKNEADFEAEAASSASTKQHHARPRPVPPLPVRPRNPLPLAIPTTKRDYHITLINEIRRVTQHLKHRPPRKYTFYEWAWYLRLIGEDEGDADHHSRADSHPRHRHQRKRGRKSGSGERSGRSTTTTTTSSGEGGVDDTAEGSGTVAGHPPGGTATAATDGGGGGGGGGDGEDGRAAKEDHSRQEGDKDIPYNEQQPPKRWSWVGSKSPLMGAQEEAEWILERLIARLGEELEAVEDEGHHDH
ncbi:hypothetical protein NEMBOFW57_009542 [Staphylotrichum longicolle]|uniref:Potassium channel domain-containing protein n=1 Tax=Staphylotrichum longicolle TaxID=669026 RepID=A0AAD4HUV3_9PEZI|nr:hypothetical protein NEMBOFW57_009542 [Staphylotrichum longicolle]